MKIVNQYIVKYNSSLATLYEVEAGKFYIEFNDLTANGWKRQIKELTSEDAATLIAP